MIYELRKAWLDLKWAVGLRIEEALGELFSTMDRKMTEIEHQRNKWRNL